MSLTPRFQRIHFSLCISIELILAIGIQCLCCQKNIIKIFTPFNHTKDGHLKVFTKRNINKVTNLEIQIHTICKVHLGNIITLNTKEIFLGKNLVSSIERLGKTRITTFHQLLNTNILHNVYELWRNLRFFQPVTVGCIQCMTHLMCDQHIINFIACFLPHRKSQHTSMDVKAGSLNFLVLYNKIFSCQEFSKLRLDLV